MNPLSPLADIAESQLGVAESNSHDNTGAAIAKYQASTWLEGQGWPWCAAFVCWCVQKFFLQYPGVVDIQPPCTPNAFGLIHWAEQNYCLVLNPGPETYPQRGDIVVYSWSHCGIVDDVSELGFTAIEGNTNPDGGRDGYEVARRPRQKKDVRNFIRLIPRALAA